MLRACTSILTLTTDSAMAILLTGGTGKTSTRIATLLHTQHIPFVVACRNPPSTSTSSYASVKFDWTDSTTWLTAFSHAIKAVYMMEPQVTEAWIPMIRFIDFAIAKGVCRFVLCAGTTATRKADGMGRVWDAFIEREVEYCVLRPSWFMGMFSIWLAYAAAQV